MSRILEDYKSGLRRSFKLSLGTRSPAALEASRKGCPVREALQGASEATIKTIEQHVS
jgi:hypothetical protein